MTAATTMDGVVVVDKPAGMTSHDVVAIARRGLQEKRIGHTGTLDPLATGVLPLACGRATRLVRFLTGCDKEYDATIRFGVSTDTYDVTGKETSRSPVRPTREALEEAIASSRGPVLQTPPPFSAKKVAGTRAYALARDEQPVELAPVPVRVVDARLLDFDGDVAVVALTCSAGFYVRSYAHDLGQRLGSGACVEALRRVRSGEFGLVDAVSLQELQSGIAAASVIPLERLLASFPPVYVTAEGLRRVSHGREIHPEHMAGGNAETSGSSAEWTRLFDEEQRLVALATAGPRPGSLHPSVVLI